MNGQVKHLLLLRKKGSYSFLFSRWNSRHKPATHYSSLFTNDDETTFPQKKLSFAKRDEKRSTHCHRPQFLRMCVEKENTVKKVLWFCQKTAYSGEHISQNAHESDESLSTHYSHFARISSVRLFFVIVCE